ncbi:MAG: hypothetical protein QGH15_07390, partial [Kiritimatiellia bacterium]|nr:hypothetical protein [Kiritimatiellia bacterium]
MTDTLPGFAAERAAEAVIIGSEQADGQFGRLTAGGSRASRPDERQECACCGSTLPAWLSELRRYRVTETVPGQTGDVGLALGLCVLSLRD